MPSSYTPLLRLTLPADGELIGTWGQTINNGMTTLEEAAIAGTVAVAMADANQTLTTVNGATDQARYNTIRLTGALTAQRNVVCPTSSKNYFVRNATTGGFGINFKTSAGTGVVVPANGAMLLYCDGTNVVQAVTTIGTLDNTVIEANSTTAALRVTQTGTGNVAVFEDAANPDSSPVVIDGNGNVVLNFTDAQTVGGNVMKLQMLATSVAGSSPLFANYNSSTGSGPTANFFKSQSGAPGTLGIIGASALLGSLNFFGDDGVAAQPGAAINAATDAAPAAGSMPTRLQFRVTPSGAVAVVEAMRIDSAGRLLISPAGTSAINTRVGSTTITPSFQMHVDSGSSQGTVGLFSWPASTSTTQLVFSKARSSVVGTMAPAISNGDPLGRISFDGSDGVKFFEGARIQAEIDGTPALDVMPTMLTFSTAGASGAVVTRMSINNAPIVKIADGTDTGQTANTNVDSLVIDGTGSIGISLLGSTTSTQQIRFGDTVANAVGGLSYTHTSDQLTFSAGSLNLLVLGSPNVTIQTDGTTSGGATPATTADALVITGSGNSGMTFSGSATATQQILFGDIADNAAGGVIYSHTNDELTLSAASAGRVVIGATSLTVEPGGVVLVPSGTAAAPGYAFTADPDCGLYRLTTNSIGLSTAGTLRLNLDANGNCITTAIATPPTLATNRDMVWNLTSNTNLRVSVRGTDGVTRVANLTLA